MVSYRSNFIAVFKIGDNIVFNLAILKRLYAHKAAAACEDKVLYRKPISILNISIIEALLHDFHFRMKNHTREFTYVPEAVLQFVRGAKIDEFGKYIACARKHDFFDLAETVFYDKLEELRQLRNRVHIQNTKNHFEPNESMAFSEARQVLSEQALEQVIITLLKKYPRDHNHVEDFALPWNTHYPNLDMGQSRTVLG